MCIHRRFLLCKRRSDRPGAAWSRYGQLHKENAGRADANIRRILVFQVWRIVARAGLPRAFARMARSAKVSSEMRMNVSICDVTMPGAMPRITARREHVEYAM